jgi:disulfide bond formation protein DsbB
MRQDGLRTARLIALLLPAALLAGAWGSQLFGLVPCEMCLWQRWPHYAAVAVAALSFAPLARPVQMLFVLFAAVSIAVSGTIGVFHAGVEYDWWEGITACTAPVGQGDAMDLLNQALRRPLVRCDVPQWTLFGISLAGFNAILSIAGAIAIFALAPRRARA